MSDGFEGDDEVSGSPGAGPSARSDADSGIAVPAGWLATAVVALVAGVGAVGGSYVAVGRTPEFVVAPVAAVVTELTPGVVVTFAITVLGDLGSKLALATAVGVTVLLLAAAVGVGRLLAVRFAGDLPAAGSVGGALVGGGVTLALTGSPISAIFTGLGGGLVVGIARGAGELGAEGSTDGGIASQARRNVVGSVAAALGIAVLGVALGDRGGDDQPLVGAGGNGDASGNESTDGSTTDTDVQRLLSLADEYSLDVDGIEPLVSENHYTVDIAQIDPKIDGEDWTLSVTGAVENEVEFTYDEITSMGREHRFSTLRCVGEGLNGHKMDNALWTGVPIADVIAEANPQGEYVMLRAEDGFYEEFPVEALRAGFLAYGMNGMALPRKHGRPARALIPGHWGEINVKWLTEIEILDEEAQGYWEQRGWHGTGPVNTVAKIHAVNHLDDGRIEVGGHTYAGTRGIETVEVSTDGGETWTEAELSEELPGNDVWRQWVYRYEADEPHEVVARATDGTGTLQPQDRAGAFPSGPTGWVSKKIRP